jgi:hypothetical protein
MRNEAAWLEDAREHCGITLNGKPSPEGLLSGPPGEEHLYLSPWKYVLFLGKSP